MTLNDPRYKGMWKMQYVLKSADGKVSTVHYVKNPKTGELLDFKFTAHSTDKAGNYLNIIEPSVKPFVK